jgi:hypothetical protein
MTLQNLHRHRKLQAAAFSNPGKRLLFVNPCPGQLTVHDADQPIGDRLLSPLVTRI